MEASIQAKAEAHKQAATVLKTIAKIIVRAIVAIAAMAEIISASVITVEESFEALIVLAVSTLIMIAAVPAILNSKI